MNTKYKLPILSFIIHIIFLVINIYIYIYIYFISVISKTSGQQVRTYKYQPFLVLCFLGRASAVGGLRPHAASERAGIRLCIDACCFGPLFLWRWSLSYCVVATKWWILPSVYHLNGRQKRMPMAREWFDAQRVNVRHA